METPTTACGTEITDKNIFVKYKGVKLYFCEKECMDEFNDNPSKFLSSDHLRIELPIL